MVRIGKGVKEPGAEAEGDCKVVLALPADPPKMQVFWDQRKDLEGADDVSFGKPSVMSCELYHRDGLVDYVVLNREVLAGNEAVNTGDVAVAGVREVSDDLFLSRVLTCSYPYGADPVDGEGW